MSVIIMYFYFSSHELPLKDHPPTTFGLISVYAQYLLKRVPTLE